MTSFRDYIQHWSNLINESRDEESRLDSQDGHDVSESGGKEPIQKGNLHVRYIINTLLNTVLVHDGIKQAKECKNPIDISQFKKKRIQCAVIDVNHKNINHDVLIQRLDGSKITEIKIEGKSSQSSSMFQKNVRFEFNEKGAIVGVNLCKQMQKDFSNANEFEEWNSIYSDISQDTIRELKSYWRRIIQSYNKHLNEMKSKMTKGMNSVKKGQWTKHQIKTHVNKRVFVKEAFNLAIEEIGVSMCSAFEFPITNLLNHYHDVAYMCVGKSFYRIGEDDPLKCYDNTTNKEFPKIADRYYGSTAKFSLAEDKGRYVMRLRVYGLKQISDGLLENARMRQ